MDHRPSVTRPYVCATLRRVLSNAPRVPQRTVIGTICAKCSRRARSYNPLPKLEQDSSVTKCSRQLSAGPVKDQHCVYVLSDRSVTFHQENMVPQPILFSERHIRVRKFAIIMRSEIPGLISTGPSLNAPRTFVDWVSVENGVMPYIDQSNGIDYEALKPAQPKGPHSAEHTRYHAIHHSQGTECAPRVSWTAALKRAVWKNVRFSVLGEGAEDNERRQCAYDRCHSGKRMGERLICNSIWR